MPEHRARLSLHLAIGSILILAILLYAHFIA